VAVTEAARERLDDYPDRAALIGSMQLLMKAARRQLPPEWERFGLDEDGWRRLGRVTHSLLGHPYFEHLGRKTIRDTLRSGVEEYRFADPRPGWKEAAATLLDSMAREPMRLTVYLVVEHLRLPDGTVVGDVRFTDPTRDPELLDAFARLPGSAPTLVCEVDVVAGTPELLRERARDAAETALALIRQQNLFGFPAKMYLDQVLYGLDGRYATRDGAGEPGVGWWRAKRTAIEAELDYENLAEWRDRLSQICDLYATLAPDLRSRVDTCLGWLDVAALSDRWRIIVPAIFSGMEALLVPESVGLKAEVVTVRSVAVHIALGRGFFDPGEVMTAYSLRNDLIHGATTSEIFEKDATDFAEFRRLWAFRVLCDYLELAKTIEAEKVGDVVRHLDEGACVDVCTWLEEHGGAAIVEQYRAVVRNRQE
jgi:hypothetical protein